VLMRIGAYFAQIHPRNAQSAAGAATEDSHGWQLQTRFRQLI